MPSGAQFYQNNYAVDDYGEEEDDDGYGMEYYEEDSDEIEPQFVQNYPPGSIF